METKYIVKDINTGEYWLEEGEGCTHLKSEAHQYSQEELGFHGWLAEFKPKNGVTLIPVINKQEK